MNGTSLGTLQIVNKTDNSLEIGSSFGLSDEFLQHFKKVVVKDGSVCSRAFHTGETIFIGDITQVRSFARHLYVAMRNNINAIQSTPLICSNGHFIGMVSTHFKITRNPSRIDLQKFERFCREAADRIDRYISK
jgi:GAF domain-containing protein